MKQRPGVILTHRHGRLDFRSDNIPLKTCQELYEQDFPYLEITEKGMQELYGIGKIITVAEPEPEIKPEPKKTRRRPQTKD